MRATFFSPLKSLNLTSFPETSTRLKFGAKSPTFGDDTGDCAVDAQLTKKAHINKVKPIFFIFALIAVWLFSLELVYLNSR
jgi:hypothetical protein